EQRCTVARAASPWDGDAITGWQPVLRINPPASPVFSASPRLRGESPSPSTLRATSRPLQRLSRESAEGAEVLTVAAEGQRALGVQRQQLRQRPQRIDVRPLVPMRGIDRKARQGRPDIVP